MMNSPHEVGEEALSRKSPLSGDSVPWNGGVMIESYYFSLRIIIVEPGGPRTPLLAWVPCTFSELL